MDEQLDKLTDLENKVEGITKEANSSVTKKIQHWKTKWMKLQKTLKIMLLVTKTSLI